MKPARTLEDMLAKARQDPKILAVLLFGSKARQQENQKSDIDICLVLPPQKYDSLSLSRIKLDYLKHFDVDIHIFQQLPLYVRHRVLKEGKVLHSKDEDLLYALAFQAAKAFDRFKPIYREYLEQVARAGS